MKHRLTALKCSPLSFASTWNFSPLSLLFPFTWRLAVTFFYVDVCTTSAWESICATAANKRRGAHLCPISLFVCSSDVDHPHHREGRIRINHEGKSGGDRIATDPGRGRVGCSFGSARGDARRRWIGRRGGPCHVDVSWPTPTSRGPSPRRHGPMAPWAFACACKRTALCQQC